MSGDQTHQQLRVARPRHSRIFARLLLYMALHYDHVPNQTYYPRLNVTYILPVPAGAFGVVLVLEGFFMLVLWRKMVNRKRV